ncbi:MAG: SPFH domain-containing protein [Crocinitomicaceae bacterium]|nr:SPFH domain-containing protein [Crocinitomicaceae bacterium]
MAILDVLKYEGPNDVLVWKWRSDSKSSRGNELRMGSQLIVNQSQEACFFNEGQLQDILGPGTHTLSTKNLPVLSGLVGLVYGGNSPFVAEVYFVNKAVSMDTKFGLTPFNMIEPTFKVPIPVSCRGSFALVVEDSRIFLTKIIGTVKDFHASTIKELFRGVITENIKSTITKISKEQNLSPLELESIVFQVSGAVKAIINNHLKEFGLSLKIFNIEGIPVIDTDQRVKDVVNEFQKVMTQDLDERMRLKRRAENLEIYKVERSFDTTEKAAENIGGSGGEAGGILGTMIGMGMVNPIAEQMGDMMAKNTGDVKENQSLGNEETIKLLKQLAELKEAGVLTDEEFASKKTELLNKLK